MEMHLDPMNSPARPSATLVMLRDGSAGLEVFLLKRHGLSDVLGGAYVFPGGKVDAEDAELHPHLDQPVPRLHAALGEPALSGAEAAALYVAALREAFEEAGVLYGEGVDAAMASGAGARLREGLAFGELLQERALRLRASALLPWSRWITPLVGGVIRKRFDTRFFVAQAPQGQLARHDDRETTESVWLAPREALRQYWEGAIELAPPQIMSLSHLARHASAASVLAQARERRPPLVQPESFEQDGERVLCYPGDARHSVRERALPGPTRLVARNRRFEPEGGLPALLGAD